MKLGCGKIYNESDVEIKYCNEKEALNGKTEKSGEQRRNKKNPLHAVKSSTCHIAVES